MFKSEKTHNFHVKSINEVNNYNTCLSILDLFSSKARFGPCDLVSSTNLILKMSVLRQSHKPVVKKNAKKPDQPIDATYLKKRLN